MRVAIVGAGLFGATAAIHAARAGHEVHLFEAKNEMMLGATAGTFCRLHRGAHYPRSPETGRESRRAEKSFRAEYGAAVIDGGKQFYIVPPHDNHVTVAGYARFLDDEGLSFSEDRGVFTVTEPRINLAMLQTLVRQKVADAGVEVHLGSKIAPRSARSFRNRFDRIVIATYARLNTVLEAFGCEPTEYKFQVVEKPIVRLPTTFKDASIVVIDGPFGCVDPMDDTDMHILGHVTKTIHAESVGFKAMVPDHLRSLLDRGMVTPKHTRFREVADDLARYIPGVEKAEHLGSQFTVRAVMAHQEATDARPTLVTPVDQQVLRVFSGKLGTAVRAAESVVASFSDREAIAA